MGEVLNSVNSQQLILRVLKNLEPGEISWLIRKMNYSAEKEESEKAYFHLCVLFANEIKKNPLYCSTFDGMCKSILARQNPDGEDPIKKKDYIKAFGWKNAVQMNRIEHGTAQMKIENIEEICSKFRYEEDRVFWKNQLLAWFPDTWYIVDSTKEYACLVRMIKSMNDTMRQRISDLLSEGERILLSDELDSCSDKSGSRLGEPPYKLYRVIYRLVREIPGMTIQTLVEDELQTTLVSWYEWKVQWEAEEKEGFPQIPKPRLHRRYVLLMALVFGLDYLETVALLQIAGYRMGSDENDRKVINYLINGEGDLNEIKLELLNRAY